MPRRAGRGLLGVVIPLVIVACAAAPHSSDVPSSGATAKKPAAAPATDASASYHFMLGYQAELAQDNEKAIQEYRAVLKTDPTSRSVKARLRAERIPASSSTSRIVIRAPSLSGRAGS